MLMDKIRALRRTPPIQLALVIRYKFHVLLGKQGKYGKALFKEWEKFHCRWQLESQKRPTYRWDDEHFNRQWSVIFGEFMGFRRNHFKSDDTLLDLGCGSRPAFDWFSDSAVKYHLDPLLAEFYKIREVKRFWEGKPDDSMLAMPAETPIKWLYDSCSFVNCWNVLDHTYDWKKIMENIAAYAKSGSYVCIGTDFKSHGIGHPGIDDCDAFRFFIEQYFRIEKEEKDLLGRELALILVRNDRPIIGAKPIW